MTDENTKHTPGKWEQNNRTVSGVSRRGLTIAVAATGSSFSLTGSAEISQKEALANARLICAAPHLLAAAKDVYEWMNNLPIPTTGCTTKMQVLYDAIAEAEGIK